MVQVSVSMKSEREVSTTSEAGAVSEAFGASENGPAGTSVDEEQSLIPSQSQVREDDQPTIAEVLEQHVLLPALAAGKLFLPLEELRPRVHVVCHGVELPGAAGVYDSWELFRYADFFLYLTVNIDA